MRFSLKEAFSEDSKRYLIGIAFETIGYNEYSDSSVKGKGWQIPYFVGDMGDIDAFATRFGIDTSSPKSYWETEFPQEDFMTGDENYYKLFVKNLDGSAISQDERAEITDMINEPDDGMGFTVNPVPYVV